MLIDQREVLKVLRCPKTGGELQQNNGHLVAARDQENVIYEIVKDYPVLIDFEKSVLKQEDATSLSSVIDRNNYSGILGQVKRLLSPLKSTTIENVQELLNLILTEQDSVTVLIIGGGTVGNGMNVFYNDPRIKLISFDIYASPSVQFLADAHNIPLLDNTFDLVIVQAVLEHVLEPHKVVSEINRVLKIGGFVYAETPFLQHVHEGAYDFTRFTDSGHRYLFREFELIKSGVISGAGTQLMWSLEYFFSGLFRSRKVGKLIKFLFFWLQYCDDIVPDSYNIDSASGVFFLGKKIDSAINLNDIITYYKGAQN